MAFELLEGIGCGIVSIIPACFLMHSIGFDEAGA